MTQFGCKPLSVTTTHSSKISETGHQSYFDGLVQDCCNPSALAMELLQFCAKPSIYTYSVCHDAPIYFEVIITAYPYPSYICLYLLVRPIRCPSVLLTFDQSNFMRHCRLPSMILMRSEEVAEWIIALITLMLKFSGVALQCLIWHRILSKQHSFYLYELDYSPKLMYTCTRTIIIGDNQIWIWETSRFSKCPCAGLQCLHC